MKSKITILIFALISAITQAQTVLEWTQMASLPEVIYSPASFAIGNKVYVVSGEFHWMSFDPVLTNHVWEYDTETDVWTQKSAFPFTMRYGARAFTIGNYGYVVCGYNGSSFLSDCCRYDPSTDTWQWMAVFPGTPRYTSATFSVGDKGYISCGFNPYQNDLWEYDSVTDTWSQKASLPGATRQALPYFVLGNDVYMGMGGQEFTLYPRDWYRYTPAADTWTQMNDFPGNALTAAFPFTINNEGYLAMGQEIDSISGDISVSNKLWKYNSSQDSWLELAPFPDTSLYEGAYASCNNAGWLGFGAKNFDYTQDTGFEFSQQWWRFGPASITESVNQQAGKSMTILSLSENMFQLVLPDNFSDTYSIQVFDVNGRSVLQQSGCSQRYYELNLSPFSAGEYLYYLQNSSGKCLNGKLIRK